MNWLEQLLGLKPQLSQPTKPSNGQLPQGISQYDYHVLSGNVGSMYGNNPGMGNPEYNIARNPNYITPGFLEYQNTPTGGQFYNYKTKQVTPIPQNALPDHSTQPRQFNSNAVIANPSFLQQLTNAVSRRV